MYSEFCFDTASPLDVSVNSTHISNEVSVSALLSGHLVPGKPPQHPLDTKWAWRLFAYAGSALPTYLAWLF
jgi:hypothetical protein